LDGEKRRRRRRRRRIYSKQSDEWRVDSRYEIRFSLEVQLQEPSSEDSQFAGMALTKVGLVLASQRLALSAAPGRSLYSVGT
jgi:DUF1680 family protein